MNGQFKSIKLVTGRGVPLPGDDIDTDRVIPARYLREVTFEHMGEYLFYDERFDNDGAPDQAHPLNDKRYKGANILIVGRNFGCGSSREHAPQSIMRYGIDAIIGESFAEIFAGNCAAMGLPAVVLSKQDIAKIMDWASNNPQEQISINLVDNTIKTSGGDYGFSMPASYRNSLIAGTWDSTFSLLENLDKIRDTANKLPYIDNFTRQRLR